MVAIQNVSNLQMRVEALVVNNKGRSIRALKPNSLGYYEKVPVAAIGVPTRNKTYYDVPSLMQQIEDPNTFFNKRLVNSGLYGEMGHPYIVGMSNDAALARLAYIDPKSTSHLFGGVYLDNNVMEDGGRLLLADIKPMGVYSSTIEQSLRDPTANTAFSLRAISTQQPKNGLMYRVIKNLVTFDTVDTGGYLQASKLYAPAMENFADFSVDVRPFSDVAIFDQVSLECFSDTELNEYFGASKVGFYRKIRTVLRADHPGEIARHSVKTMTSVFHDLFRE